MIEKLEKKITLKCRKGSWEIEFWNEEGELPVTVFDMKIIKRTLVRGHKDYLRLYNLDQKRRKRESEEQHEAKVKLATSQAKTLSKVVST